MKVYVISRNDFPYACTPSHEKARKCIAEKTEEEDRAAEASGLHRRNYWHLSEVEFWG